MFDPIIPQSRLDALTNTGAWPDTLVIDALDEAARNRPNHPAVIDFNSSSGQVNELTYADLHTLSYRIAGGLLAIPR